MKIFVVAHRSEKHSPEDFAPLLEAETRKAFQLMAENVLREIYSRADGKGAVLVLEAESAEEARRRLSELPLAQKGMLRFDVYPVGPYRAFVAAAKA